MSSLAFSSRWDDLMLFQMSRSYAANALSMTASIPHGNASFVDADGAVPAAAPLAAPELATKVAAITAACCTC